MSDTTKLTITIRDDSPMLHCGDSPSYRSVQIELTPEQLAKISLRHKEEAKLSGYYEVNEIIGVFPAQPIPKHDCNFEARGRAVKQP